jgi:hypothetical protein
MVLNPEKRKVLLREINGMKVNPKEACRKVQRYDQLLNAGVGGHGKHAKSGNIVF